MHLRISAAMYVRRLRQKIRKYIDHCNTCLTLQPKRHKPYRSLNPIDSAPVPFHTITINIVLSLLHAQGYDVLMIVTDKFSKAVAIFPGRSDWSAQEQAKPFLKILLLTGQGIPTAIISDRDRKFVSKLWKTILKQISVQILLTTAYYPQADGQSKRTNQTVEIALRTFVLNYPDQDWVDALPALQYHLNNSQSASTKLSPHEVLYGMRTKEPIDAALEFEGIKGELSGERILMRVEAVQAIAEANTKAKYYFNRRYRPLLLSPGDRVYIKLYHGYSNPDQKGKLSKRYEGPFTIRRRVGRLTYEIEIPLGYRKMYLVISITYLEPTLREEDPYRRQPTQLGPVEVDGEDDEEQPAYEVERVLDKRRLRIRGGKE